jgi:hypothetical protein
MPNGKTILHMLKNNIDSIKALYQIVSVRESEDKEPFYVPILEDNKGNTILQNLLIHPQKAVFDQQSDNNKSARD